MIGQALKKSISIQISSFSKCARVNSIQKNEYPLLFISIEGNIGSGKSTLMNILQMHVNDQCFKFINEPVEEWKAINKNPKLNLLQQFYENPSRWAYSFQLFAIYTRIEHWRKFQLETKVNNHQSKIITERCIASDREIFAKNLYIKGLISELEMQMYNQITHNMIKTLDHFDQMIIYVKTPVEICHQRIHERNRAGENNISLEYLMEIEKRHKEWLQTINPESILQIDGLRDFKCSKPEQNKIVEEIIQNLNNIKVINQ